MGNILQYLLKCLCLRSLSGNRHRKSYKKHYLFAKAEERLNQELDIVRILRALRKFSVLNEAVLSQRQRMMIRFSRKHLIETSSSSPDSDDHR